MTYPLSTDVSAGQPTAVAHYNTLRADALRLGQAEGDCVTTGVMLRRYARGVRLQYLATNRLRVPYVTTDPATLMINGFMCQAGANVDLPAGLFSGGAATWYVFANRTAGSTTFTLSVNTSGSEGTDQRVIGEVSYDGANIISIKDYFASPLGDADYSSGWFAAAYNNTYTKAHGLSQHPRLVVVEHSANAAGTGEIVPVAGQLGQRGDELRGLRRGQYLHHHGQQRHQRGGLFHPQGLRRRLPAHPGLAITVQWREGGPPPYQLKGVSYGTHTAFDHDGLPPGGGILLALPAGAAAQRPDGAG